MLFNTTNNNKDTTALINEMLGISYSFIKAIKLGGVGSKRMIIEAVSPGFESLINSISDINYGNIELREKGILVHINKGLKNFSWAIPYYQLHTYKTACFSIHAQGNFVRFKSDKLLKENKNLTKKMH